MFALTLLSTAYTVVVLMYYGSGLVWSPAKPIVIFVAWGAMQTLFAAAGLFKLRYERQLRSALEEKTRAEAVERNVEAASEIRYQDYFENLTEMIAMLS